MNDPLLPDSNCTAEVRALSVLVGNCEVAVVTGLHAMHCPLDCWQREAVGGGDQNVCCVRSVGEEIANYIRQEIG